MKKTSENPPQLFLRFFRWFCHPQMIDYIEGDLFEVYRRRLKTNGKRNADMRFMLDVLLLFRPGIIRPSEGHNSSNNYGMIKSYFTIGWRNLLRNRGYSIINIGGLAIGMTVAILNGLWVWDELTYNQHFKNYDNIGMVAVGGLDTEHGGTWFSTTMTYPLSTAMHEQYRDNFKHVSRLSWTVEPFVSTGTKTLSIKGAYVEEEFPEMFTLNMISGTRAGLNDTHAVLLSQSAAKTLFGDEDALHKTLRIGNKIDVTVNGVYEDFPQNTQFDGFQFVGSWGLFLLQDKWIEERALNDWRNHFLRVLVEIPEGTSFESVTAKVKPALQFDPADAEDAKLKKTALSLYPMSRWHLHPARVRDGQFEPVKMVVLVGSVGVFVLALACINFMNLSTARSEKRAKEVGIRKTVGSVRSQLINQFYSESLLVVIFSFAVALALCILFLPSFNLIASKQIVMPWANVFFWIASVAFIIFTSILAGSYPALFLSSFNPVRALKGSFKAGPLASIPRKVLVVFQFSISVILIVGTSIVYQQVQYAKDRPVGYNREGLIAIEKKSDDFKGKYNVLRNELKATGMVEEVSESMGPPTEVYSGNNGWDWSGRDPKIDKSFATLAVSHTHGRTAGWQFISGRDFDINITNDSSGIVVNESAAKFMGLKNPVGEALRWTWWSDKRVIDYKIIGVIKDLVMDSPYRPVEPTVFYLKGFNGKPGWMNIRVRRDVSMSEALPAIEAVFKRLIPSAPFEYNFVDEEYAKKFAREERVGNLAAIFGVLAVFISSLGLLGLSSFVVEQRKKEIGIRKVLGASVVGLWKMLSQEFVMLVVIACLMAIPAAWYWFDQWLQNFPFRTEISIWILMLTISGALAITLITVSYQAIRAALTSPVKSLSVE